MSVDVRKILVLGPGPTRLGQGAELDHATVQAVRALVSEGCEVVVASSNPSSLCTDPELVARTYLEPLDAETVLAILERERPSALLAGFGGPDARAATLSLEERGELDRLGIVVLGALREGLIEASREDELELDVEVLRDVQGHARAVCVASLSGPHDTDGADVVVTFPSELTAEPLRLVRDAACEAVSGAGHASVRMAWNGTSARVLAVRPFYTGGSAFASSATGLRVAELATRLLLGRTLDAVLPAAPPTRDDVLVRVPRFELDRYPGANRQLGWTARNAGHTYGRGKSRIEAEQRAAGSLRTGSVPASAGGAVLFVGGPGADLATCLAEAIATARALGKETWLLGCDPGSAAALAADHVFVEPATLENVSFLCASKAVAGVVLQFAGESALALATSLASAGLPLLGTSAEAMQRAALLASPVRDEAASFDKIDVDVVADGTEAVLGGVIAYVERVGVHSGDSAAILPPQELPESALRAAEAEAKKLALTLGIRGAMSVQFAVRGEQVQTIEVTARASRTLVLASRATGRNLSRMATEAALGQALSARGATDAPLTPFVVARECVFPFAILGAKDTLLGPEMRSTGEGAGVADTAARAYRKALRAIGKDLRRPRGDDPRRALLRVAARDRSACVEIARRLRALGFDLSAAPETAEILRAMRIPHDILDDALPEGSVGLAIVTAETAAEVAESRALRQRALMSGVTCVTTVALARSVCSAMEESGATESVRTLQEWLSLMGNP